LLGISEQILISFLKEFKLHGSEVLNLQDFLFYLFTLLDILDKEPFYNKQKDGEIMENNPTIYSSISCISKFNKN